MLRHEAEHGRIHLRPGLPVSVEPFLMRGCPMDRFNYVQSLLEEP